MRLIAFLLVLAGLTCSAALVPVLDTTNNIGLLIVTPSGGTTNQTTARNYMTAPSGASENFPFVFRLLTNQSFCIVDELGNNIFGVRHDPYAANGSKHWMLCFGSKQQGMIDTMLDMGAGADFVIGRINGDLNNSFQMQTYGAGVGICFIYSNTNYFGDFHQVPLFDNYGTVFPTSIYGVSPHLAQTAVVGAAAGTGGSVGVTMDGNPSDISIQLTLTTGNAGTTAGTAVTYTTGNEVSQFNAIIQPTTMPWKPVGSPANDNAAAEFTKVKFTGTTGTVLVQVRAGQALTVNTVYVWNIFLCR